MPRYTSNGLFDIWGTSNDNVFAVGRNTILRYGEPGADIPYIMIGDYSNTITGNEEITGISKNSIFIAAILVCAISALAILAALLIRRRARPERQSHPH